MMNETISENFSVNVQCVIVQYLLGFPFRNEWLYTLIILDFVNSITVTLYGVYAVLIMGTQ